ncbi:NADP-dependent glutamate dehydrogenase [Saccharomyces pastorianus]|uniref:Glutamate dehydrogenase n=1 Tax=Saccharomyces pastorianus TaxID=27292 RepID=A0A6C1E1I4_SACPS|nr:NADP-dependent glutamate dehydrogenase [Saccharomyces pastorianus]
MVSEPEFQQAYYEIVSSVKDSTLFEKFPQYEKVLPVVSVPERIIQFRVTWENDKGEQEVAQGYRVQFNSAKGPYKGGLRFHPSVNLSILKFLGFEQIFKNALTGLDMGGGKGGLCVDLKGKSDNEIRRICYAFMRELSKHIGKDTDVPAGDIGVGGREIGYLFGAYRSYKNSWEGVLTGKGLNWGGSLIRPEATGYGLVYYTQAMIDYATNGKESFEGKRVTISGSGNVAQYAALKVIEREASWFRCITLEQINDIAATKIHFKSLKEIVGEYATFGENKVKYIAGARPWTHVSDVDIALPCATQNEVSGDEAKSLVASGVKFVAEGANMGSTPEAISVFETARSTAATAGDAVWFGPPKAANLGGVAVSGLEMAQNSQKVTWTSERVDQELKKIMINCFNDCIQAAQEYATEKNTKILPSLVKGANIASFVMVADAMLDQGDVF